MADPFLESGMGPVEGENSAWATFPDDEEEEGEEEEEAEEGMDGVWGFPPTTGPPLDAVVAFPLSSEGRPTTGGKNQDGVLAKKTEPDALPKIDAEEGNDMHDVPTTSKAPVINMVPATPLRDRPTFTTSPAVLSPQTLAAACGDLPDNKLVFSSSRGRETIAEWVAGEGGPSFGGVEGCESAKMSSQLTMLSVGRVSPCTSNDRWSTEVVGSDTPITRSPSPAFLEDDEWMIVHDSWEGEECGEKGKGSVSCSGFVEGQSGVSAPDGEMQGASTPADEMEKEPEDEMEKEAEDEMEKEPEDEVHKDPEDEVHKDPEDEVHKDPEDEVHKDPEDEVHKEPEDEVHKDPEDEVHKDPEDEVHKEPEDEVHKEPEDEVHKDPEDEVHKDPEDEVHKDPEDEVHKDPEDEVHKDPEDEVHKDPEDEVHKDPEDEVHKDPEDEVQKQVQGPAEVSTPDSHDLGSPVVEPDKFSSPPPSSSFSPSLSAPLRTEEVVPPKSVTSPSFSGLSRSVPLDADIFSEPTAEEEVELVLSPASFPVPVQAESTLEKEPLPSIEETEVQKVKEEEEEEDDDDDFGAFTACGEGDGGDFVGAEEWAAAGDTATFDVGAVEVVSTPPTTMRAPVYPVPPAVFAAGRDEDIRQAVSHVFTQIFPHPTPLDTKENRSLSDLVMKASLDTGFWGPVRCPQCEGYLAGNSRMCLLCGKSITRDGEMRDRRWHGSQIELRLQQSLNLPDKDFSDGAPALLPPLEIPDDVLFMEDDKFKEWMRGSPKPLCRPSGGVSADVATWGEFAVSDGRAPVDIRHVTSGDDFSRVAPDKTAVPSFDLSMLETDRRPRRKRGVPSLRREPTPQKGLMDIIDDDLGGGRSGTHTTLTSNASWPDTPPGADTPPGLDFTAWGEASSTGTVVTPKDKTAPPLQLNIDILADLPDLSFMLSEHLRLPSA